jgi:translation initiation factor 2 subunit 1
VVVEVTEVEENASYVKLLEYNNIKGMITPNEMTRALKGGV